MNALRATVAIAMLGVAAVVTLGVVCAWWLAMRRRRHRDDTVSDAMAARDGLRWMVGGGVVLFSEGKELALVESRL